MTNDLVNLGKLLGWLVVLGLAVVMAGLVLGRLQAQVGNLAPGLH